MQELFEIFSVFFRNIFLPVKGSDFNGYRTFTFVRRRSDVAVFTHTLPCVPLLSKYRGGVLRTPYI